MTSPRGNTVANQFIIRDDEGDIWFQSYDSIIVKIINGDEITLDKRYWDYSRTTSKYRNIFLDEDTKTTQAKIDSGEYQLADLN